MGIIWKLKEVLLIICILKKTTQSTQRCVWSALTIKTVPSCPATEEETKRAARIKKCLGIGVRQNCTNPLQFKYHCLYSPLTETLVEVCAVEMSISGVCLVYNTKLSELDLLEKVKCTDFPTPCPENYLSTKAHLDAPCQKFINLTSNSTSNEGKKEETETTNILVWILLSTVLGTLFLVIITIVIILRVRRKKNLCWICTGDAQQKMQEVNECPEDENDLEMESTYFGEHLQMTKDTEQNVQEVNVCSNDESDLEMESTCFGEHLQMTTCPEDENDLEMESISYGGHLQMISLKREKRRVLLYGSDHMPNCGDSKMRERNVETLLQGLCKADRRIFDLFKEQYNLKGRVKYLEIKLDILNPLLIELEKDMCETLSESSHDNSSKNSVRDRIAVLECEYSSILRKIEKIEPGIISKEGPSTPSPEATILGSGTASDGAYGIDLLGRVHMLESSLVELERRLNILYDAGYGKEGKLKSFLVKLEGLESVMDELEIEYGLPVDRFEVTEMRTMVMADTGEERLFKLFDRLENLDLLILK